ncbi:baseplate assembly protein [Pantoea ananatis]|uniref:baseplate assembly protein n=1 Tax=Pantoea ananas TaxID=553 RepID=UPI000736EA44|nr:baseplate assembly protein [Pantoea ananatis]KTR46513.1 baseplate assembly protein [Pantoea ananatis]KTR51949.1 baseplate assembly protein [Pantoea ananatis]KTR62800.1 baseplate assembly protein [Pantoea ananatis]KTR67673.1 baseplate assembly protein [Pantoea ananatis]PZD61110.1 baseplate assembly protein [Pantoea ananatis]
MPTIDLSQLPAPNVVETLDYETLLAERKATLISLYPADEQASVARVLALESDPLVKLLQENAYREVILRQRINEAAKAVMVAWANGSDLDQLGANNGVTRLMLTPADNTATPPVEAVMERDEDFRARIAAAFEGLSVAGPSGAYEFHARSADGRVADASAISPSPASVTITVLSREGNGAAGSDLLAIVNAALNDEDVRPVADRVTVQSAQIVDYRVDATLYLYPGPEAEPIRAAAEAKLKAFVNTQARLGRDIRKSALYAALHVEGVQRVELAQPVADVVLDKTQAAFCTGYQITVGGSDE